MVSKRFSPNTKRKIRREAGYGCCRCGNEIIQYHHLNPKSNKAEDGMALCPCCHDMATRGAMPISEQLEYKRNPYNIKEGHSKGKLIINKGTIPLIFAGHNTIRKFGDIVTVNDESLLTFNVNKDGVTELSLKLYDENNDIIMEIINNEWISGDYFAWDIEVSYEWMIIRRKKQDIILDIKTHGVIELRADLWWRGYNLKIGPDAIKGINPHGDMPLFLTGAMFDNIGFIIDENGGFSLGSNIF